MSSRPSVDDALHDAQLHVTRAVLALMAALPIGVERDTRLNDAMTVAADCAERLAELRAAA